MRPHGLGTGRHLIALVLLTTALGFGASRSVHADPPQVTVGPAGTRIRIVSATLAEVIDALARAAGFKVTYESSRPGAMLFNVDIDAPNVAQALARVLDGQSLNHGVVFDVTGASVTSLLIMGTPPRSGASAPPPSAARPQALPTPPPQRDQPPPEGAQGETTDPVNEPQPTPAPTPLPTPGLTQSPFRPRPNFPRPFSPQPFGPPPSPSASPGPSPST